MNLLAANILALLLAAIFIVPAVAIYALLGYILPKSTIVLLLLAGTSLVLLLALVLT